MICFLDELGNFSKANQKAFKFYISKYTTKKRDGPEWTGMDQNGPGWTRMDQDGPGWTRMDQDGLGGENVTKIYFSTEFGKIFLPSCNGSIV